MYANRDLGSQSLTSTQRMQEGGDNVKVQTGDFEVILRIHVFHNYECTRIGRENQLNCTLYSYMANFIFFVIMSKGLQSIEHV